MFIKHNFWLGYEQFVDNFFQQESYKCIQIGHKKRKIKRNINEYAFQSNGMNMLIWNIF